MSLANYPLSIESCNFLQSEYILLILDQLMEDKVNTLQSLTFTAMPTQGANPTLDRRAKVIARLEEQKLILKDPNYTGTIGSGRRRTGKGSWLSSEQ